MSGAEHGVVKRLTFGLGDTPSPLHARTVRSTLHCAPRTNLASRGSGPGSATLQDPIGPTPGRYGLLDERPSTSGRAHSRPGNSVSYRVPSDEEWTDDEEEEVTSTFQQPVLVRPSPAEEQLQLWERELQASVLVTQQAKHLQWQLRLADIEQGLSQQLGLVASSIQRKEAEQQQQDAALAARHQEERQQRLRQLQASHEKAAAAQQQQVERLAAEEAEKRRKQEEAERRRREEEEAARRRDEEARARAAEEEARQKAEQERRAAEAAAKQAAPAPAPSTAVGSTASPAPQASPAPGGASAASPAGQGSNSHPCLRTSPEALAMEERCAAQLAAAQALVADLVASDAAKKQRRDIEKKMTTHLQQVSGTQAQVKQKCEDLYKMLCGLAEPWRTYAMLMFVKKFISQEGLVQLNNKAAFPLALVAVKLSEPFPQLLSLVVASLHKECPLTVPKAYVLDKSKISSTAYYRNMGFQLCDDPSAPEGKVFEGVESYLRRLEGIMLLYAAIMQVDDPNPHGLPIAWSYLARLVNHLPADRASGKALIAFLRVAGYAMHQRYRGQFVKALQAVARDFVPALRASNDDDVAAVAAVLEAYITDARYRVQPEGRDMPRIDLSSMRENRA